MPLGPIPPQVASCEADAPAPWSTFSPWTLVRSLDQAHDGVASVLVTTAATPSAMQATSDEFAVDGSFRAVRGWLWADVTPATIGYVGVSAYDSDHALLSTSTTTRPLVNGAWVGITNYFGSVFGPSFSFARLFVQLLPTGAETFTAGDRCYFDDFSVPMGGWSVGRIDA